jgi:hypothetical protein
LSPEVAILLITLLVATPAIGVVGKRVYLNDNDHRIVGEYGATGTDLAPKTKPFIRKIYSFLNGSFRRPSSTKQTISFRPKVVIA